MFYKNNQIDSFEFFFRFVNKGTPVFVDNNLAIYVQEWENRKCIEHISNVLTNWHQKHVKNPRRLWYDGEICVAQRNSDRMYYRAEIQRVLVKQRKCLVNKNFFRFFQPKSHSFKSILASFH